MELDQNVVLYTPDKRSLNADDVVEIRQAWARYAFSGIGPHEVTPHLVDLVIGTDFLPFRFEGMCELLLAVRTWPYTINGKSGFFSTSVRISILEGALRTVQVVPDFDSWTFNNWTLTDWNRMEFPHGRLEIWKHRSHGEPLLPPDDFQANRFTTIDHLKDM